ncbi:glycosyltransferase family 25 protein [Salipiger mucosus]|nr:glycosyltransferase family 25 protein [Salipiger mucosus]
MPVTRGGEALLSIFDRVYVINLPDRADRRAEMAAQLSRLGLGFDHPSVTLVPGVRPDDPGEFPGLGVRGCYMSHLSVLEAGLRDGAERFLLLEDDADFVRGIEERLPALAAAARDEDWGLLWAHMPGRYHAPPTATPDLLHEVSPDTPIKLAHMVGVTREAAELALPYLRAIAERPYDDPAGGPMHVDGAYFWFRRAHPGVRTLAPETALALQRSSRSDIHRGRWYETMPVVGELVAGLRRAKNALR